jgi:AcrR family transcriptional regulator
MRARILAIAATLYVRHGYGGFSFADIAEAAGTTRANIHYHFGNKHRLMAEVIAGFVADAADRIGRHWTAPGTGFAERWRAQLDDLRRFYRRFNPTGAERGVWSPMSRLRLDMPVLGARATTALAAVNDAYDTCLRRAVTEAVAAGELRHDAPVDDIARLLRVTMLSCGPMTQDTGTFDDVEHLFAAMARTIAAAWGTPGLAAQLEAALDRDSLSAAC